MGAMNAPRNPRNLSEIADAAEAARAVAKEATETWSSLRTRLTDSLEPAFRDTGMTSYRAGSEASAIIDRIGSTTRQIEDLASGMDHLAETLRDAIVSAKSQRKSTTFVE